MYYTAWLTIFYFFFFFSLLINCQKAINASVNKSFFYTTYSVRIVSTLFLSTSCLQYGALVYDYRVYLFYQEAAMIKYMFGLGKIKWNSLSAWYIMPVIWGTITLTDAMSNKPIQVLSVVCRGEAPAARDDTYFPITMPSCVSSGVTMRDAGADRPGWHPPGADTRMK